MAVRDARGNQLKEGDVVSLEIPSTRVVGDVQKVANGGIVTGTRAGKDHVTAGEVIVLVAFRLTVDPTNPTLGNVLKLHADVQGENGKSGPVLELPN